MNSQSKKLCGNVRVVSAGFDASNSSSKQCLLLWGFIFFFYIFHHLRPKKTHDCFCPPGLPTVSDLQEGALKFAKFGED